MSVVVSLINLGLHRNDPFLALALGKTARVDTKVVSTWALTSSVTSVLAHLGTCSSDVASGPKIGTEMGIDRNGLILN